ncbi:hypothetical protein XOCp0010 (plasmid) [Xanthomonas oryzae pv. oryzicola]|nr:hypothetical protein XOCp0010 [Xanthomonas oryzae pv. oryzicola]
MGEGWAALPIAGRPRLVHGARPKAGCDGRFRPPGAARTVGKRWATCSPGVGAAGAGTRRSTYWPAAAGRRSGKRSAQGRGLGPSGDLE